MAGLAEAAGLPGGALNVLTGEGVPAGATLSGHPGVDKVSFTGSVPTGQVRINDDKIGLFSLVLVYCCW